MFSKIFEENVRGEDSAQSKPKIMKTVSLTAYDLITMLKRVTQ